MMGVWRGTTCHGAGGGGKYRTVHSFECGSGCKRCRDQKQLQEAGSGVSSWQGARELWCRFWLQCQLHAHPRSLWGQSLSFQYFVSSVTFTTHHAWSETYWGNPPCTYTVKILLFWIPGLSNKQFGTARVPFLILSFQSFLSGLFCLSDKQDLFPFPFFPIA